MTLSSTAFHVAWMAGLGFLGLATARLGFRSVVSPVGMWSMMWALPTTMIVFQVLPGVPRVGDQALQLVWLASGAFVLGAVLPLAGLVRRPGRWGEQVSEAETYVIIRFARASVLLSIVCYMAMVMAVGGIPMFSENANELRIESRIPFLVSGFHVGKIGVFLYAVASRLISRRGRRLVLVDRTLLVAGILLPITTGWRGDAMTMLIFWGVTRALMEPSRKVSLRKAVPFALAILAIFYAVDVIRIQGFQLGVEQLGLGAPGPDALRRPLLYVQPQFVNLDRALVVETQRTFGYSSFGFILRPVFLDRVYAGPELASAGRFPYLGGSNALTYLYYLFVDFGWWGAVLGSLVLGFVGSYGYRRLRSGGSESLTWLAFVVVTTAGVFFMLIGLWTRSAAVTYWLIFALLAEHLGKRKQKRLEARYCSPGAIAGQTMSSRTIAGTSMSRDRSSVGHS